MKPSMTTADFETALATWGPDAPARPVCTQSEAELFCRQLTNSHYENFTVVSWMLPRHLRQHFANVYAYCRWSDDLGDEVGDRERAKTLLAWWRQELMDCYADRVRHPVFIALKHTIQEFNIPIEPFADLLSAFEQDQSLVDYQAYTQLLDYCRRSANPVGRLVLYLAREHREENLAMSDAVCTGLQLANFWQDVARDYDIGRVYLPKEDRDRFGYTDEDLRSRRMNQAFVELMQFQVQRARSLLIEGLPLARRLPGRLQIDIELFARGGLKILDRIVAMNYCVWGRRPVVTKRDQLGLLARCSFNAAIRLFRQHRPETK